MTPALPYPSWPGWGLPPGLTWGRGLAGLLRRPRALALRIDVAPPADRVEADLDALYRRLQRRGDALHGIASTPTNRPGLVLRWREADGEFYVYVEDRQHRRLAGTTVFNRLIELHPRADRHLRAPHSRYHPAYQRQGLATAVYRWGLDAGLCLVTGARQSPGAHALWQALARHYPLIYVDLRERGLRQIAPEAADPAELDALHTRMLLLGRGWCTARLADEAGLEALSAPPAPGWPCRSPRPGAAGRARSGAPVLRA